MSPEIKRLCDIVRQTAYDIHAYHGQGHREKIYENALAHRLRKAGIQVEQQVPIKVFDEDGTLLGEDIADLLIGGVLLVEAKATRVTSGEHISQLLGYLKSYRLEHGLLINFGTYRFDIRKYAWSEERHRAAEA